MPIYEFYCPDCHTLFSFFSRRVNTEKQPDCPRCGRAALDRQVSLFAISRGRKDGDEDLPELDDERMEQLMGSLAGEMDSVDEDDPKAVGRLMRRIYDSTGLKLSESMREAIARMESGEDMDRIEEDLGDQLDGEDPFAASASKGLLNDLKRRLLPPRVDETLYDL
ncbi:MAG: zinc ribbon domain-containing protein [Gammaproteobacteria bacterium]|jgi:putative FmdB family regulatory protein|nr:zinc ribbon domain-containing protein [Gammaproteobacteria bacterium]